jgi:cytoskeletal protein RodZ
MWTFSWIFSKIGAAVAAVLGVLGLWLWGKHQQTKREQAEARAKVAETRVEVNEDEEKRHEQVDRSSDDELIDYWRK